MLNEFLLLATANVFAVASPGADFAVVIKNTLRSGKSTGIATAFGIGLGLLVHVTYTLLGVAIILSKSEFLFHSIKYLGAAYLLWLAYMSFQSRKNNKNVITEMSHIELKTSKAIKQGFIVNVLNPKVTLFFVALFANIVNPDTPFLIQAAYGLWISIYAIFWFSLVAWGFSRKIVLVWYQQHGHYFDWGMGMVLLLIAVRLVL